jgi:hypothetical protein
MGAGMKLKRHHEDLKDLQIMQGLESVNPIVLAHIRSRYRHLISWADAVLEERNPHVVTMELRERKVLKDSALR